MKRFKTMAILLAIIMVGRQIELAYKEALARLESANAELDGQKANLFSKKADYEASFSQVKNAEAALDRDPILITQLSDHR
ncbi:MAG: hypothetical protein HF982_06840 [Desulfobacteraceae bacterium]|nr:hypothetical protein [Desulfobacteraceae bacterium]MBC2719287.1 hypothetical protein [Desulfobacteraceae bacterium]